MVRLGVLGGTFDPVHVGHLVAAVNVRDALDLDKVLMVVAGEPWQKVGTRDISPAEDRLAVVAAAVGDVDGIEPCDLEIRRAGVSYTADTLQQLHDQYGPDAELFLIVGDDVAASLDTWERVDVVRDLATLVVVNRPGTERAVLDEAWRVETVEIPNLEISSSDLRARAADGRPLDYLVPAAAVRCIRERGLYARRR